MFSFLKFKKKQNSTIQLKNSDSVVLDTFDFSFLNGSVTPYNAHKVYDQFSPVAIAVNKIASAIEQISPIIVDKDGNSIDNADPLEFLEGPNDYQQYQEFIGEVVREYLLTGNSYVFVNGVLGRPPVEVYSVKSKCISIYDGGKGWPMRFMVGSNSIGSGIYSKQSTPECARFFSGNMAELGYISSYNPNNNLRGKSVLDSVMKQIKAAVEASHYNEMILKNGGNLSNIILFKDSPNNDQIKARAKMLRDQYSGTNNAGKIAVLDGEKVDVITVGASPKDMNFKELTDWAAIQVYGIYDIPVELVMQTSSTYNNISTLVPEFYRQAVLPLCKKVFSLLTRLILSRYGKKYDGFRFSYDVQQVESLKKQAIEDLKKRKELGVETINELRLELPGRNKLKGGDELYQPANLVAISDSELDFGGE